MIPLPLRIPCDSVLQTVINIAHNPGIKNTAADFLSRLEMDPIEEIIRKIRDGIPTRLIEVNIDSTGIPHEKPGFFDTTDQHETIETELWKRKGQT